jgi:uncharacterized protein (DUF58 family)
VAVSTPTDILSRVRRIEITARRLVTNLFAGQYSSTFKGRGMEFSEVREYFPGDDVRSIDWNVTARMGHPYIKKFVEERELTVLFWVDASGSLGFGARGQWKSERAAEITAMLAFSALRNNDKAGLAMFSDRVEKYIPPRKTRGHMLRLIREVLTHRPAGAGTSLAEALDFLNRVQRRRAVVFLISDFLDQGYEKALRIAERRHDLIAVPVRDGWEEKWPAGGRILLEDAETGQAALVSGGAAFRRDYARRAAQSRGELETLFRRTGTDAVFTQTGAPYIEAFLRLFAERARRLR